MTCIFGQWEHVLPANMPPMTFMQTHPKSCDSLGLVLTSVRPARDGDLEPHPVHFQALPRWLLDSTNRFGSCFHSVPSLPSRKFRDFCSQGSSQLREQVGRIVKLTASKHPNTGLRVHFRPSPFRPATSDPSTIRVCGRKPLRKRWRSIAWNCTWSARARGAAGCCMPTKRNDARSRSSKNEG